MDVSTASSITSCESARLSTPSDRRHPRDCADAMLTNKDQIVICAMSGHHWVSSEGNGAPYPFPTIDGYEHYRVCDACGLKMERPKQPDHNPCCMGGFASMGLMLANKDASVICALAGHTFCKCGVNCDAINGKWLCSICTVCGLYVEDKAFEELQSRSVPYDNCLLSNNESSAYPAQRQ